MNESGKRKSMISVRDGYSDRNGLNPVCNVMQVDDLDDRTRKILVNRIWDEVETVFNYIAENYPYSYNNQWRECVNSLKSC